MQFEAMHDEPDRFDHQEMFGNLPLLERSLAWCFRCWVIGVRSGIDVKPRLQQLFRELRADDAFPYLDGLMWALTAAGTRVPAIPCVCEAGLSDAESMLLDALALLEAGRPEDAHALLARLAPGQDGRIAGISAARLVTALTQAGHRLPRRDQAVRRHALALQAGPSSQPVSFTLH